jgi:hypothetical protein
LDNLIWLTVPYFALPTFALATFILFWVQFFVPRRLKWLAKLVLNVAWMVLVTGIITVDYYEFLTAKGYLKLLALFAVFTMLPFFLGSLVGSLLQQMLADVFHKMRRHK